MKSTTITQELENMIKVHSFKSSKINKYEKAIRVFDKMVKDGVTKRRGYNLMTVEKAHLNRYYFNAKS